MNNLLGLERIKLLKLMILETEDYDSPPRHELPVVPEGHIMDEETARDFLACNDRSDLKKFLCKLKEKSLNARMKFDHSYHCKQENL